MTDRPNRLESGVDAPPRSDLVTNTYGDRSFTTAGRPVAGADDGLPKVDLYDSKGDTTPKPGGDGPPQPPKDPNEVRYDNDGRIIGVKNGWGSQDIEYSKDDPDRIKVLQTNGSEGPMSYRKQPDGTYKDDNGKTYKNVSIDQNTGDLTFVNDDGSKRTQFANGDSAAFEADGRPKYRFDRAKNESTYYQYDSKTGAYTGSVVTNVRTGETRVVNPDRQVEPSPEPDPPKSGHPREDGGSEPKPRGW